MKVYWNGLTMSKSAFLKTMHREYSDHVYWRRKGDVEIPIGKIKKRDFYGW
jgi:hypothetical protein